MMAALERSRLSGMVSVSRESASDSFSGAPLGVLARRQRNPLHAFVAQGDYAPEVWNPDRVGWAIR